MRPDDAAVICASGRPNTSVMTRTPPPRRSAADSTPSSADTATGDRGEGLSTGYESLRGRAPVSEARIPVGFAGFVLPGGELLDGAHGVRTGCERPVRSKHRDRRAAEHRSR